MNTPSSPRVAVGAVIAPRASVDCNDNGSHTRLPVGSREREVVQTTILPLGTVLDQMFRLKRLSTIASGLFWIEVTTWSILCTTCLVSQTATLPGLVDYTPSPAVALCPAHCDASLCFEIQRYARSWGQVSRFITQSDLYLENMSVRAAESGTLQFRFPEDQTFPKQDCQQHRTKTGTGNIVETRGIKLWYIRYVVSSE